MLGVGMVICLVTYITFCERHDRLPGLERQTEGTKEILERYAGPVVSIITRLAMEMIFKLWIVVVFSRSLKKFYQGRKEPENHNFMKMPVVKILQWLLAFAILDILCTIGYMSWIVAIEYKIDSPKLLGVIFGLKRFFDFFIIACMYHHWSDSIDCLAKHYIWQNEPINAHSVLPRMPVKKYNPVTKSFDLDSNLDRDSDQNI